MNVVYNFCQFIGHWAYMNQTKKKVQFSNRLYANGFILHTNLNFRFKLFKQCYYIEIDMERRENLKNFCTYIIYISFSLLYYFKEEILILYYNKQ